MLLVFFWMFLFFYLLYNCFLKINVLGGGSFLGELCFKNFVLQSGQFIFFFKMMIFILTVFWLAGLVFPLFSPWGSVIYLLLMTNLSWLGGRMFTLLCSSFLVFFEEDHSWDWLTSIIMFFSHLLSFLMSGVALSLRISIIFLIGHFLMFFVSSLGVLSGSFFMMLVFLMEVFFALLQSYIFLTLISMFLLNMI
uniref:ATP synthase F0 subunit 6 n=1 Tax=Thelazia callipaeda TaxID=103827 RepID=A0A1E1GJ03_THECL|nr:ATP synthase F0 subunit 6 [Thelazia callipaeda]ASS35187.1 ATP synthase F0 subunit 6 [Thelazia callipaeda]BAV82853.1 ATP synthase F0 subunit 6 [Thelazia callipaeda]